MIINAMKIVSYDTEVIRAEISNEVYGEPDGFVSDVEILSLIERYVIDEFGGVVDGVMLVDENGNEVW